MSPALLFSDRIRLVSPPKPEHTISLPKGKDELFKVFYLQLLSRSVFKRKICLLPYCFQIGSGLFPRQNQNTQYPCRKGKTSCLKFFTFNFYHAQYLKERYVSCIIVFRSDPACFPAKTRTHNIPAERERRVV